MRYSNVAVVFFMVSAQAAPGVPIDLKFEVATLKHSPLLTPGNSSVTLQTLTRAARAIGRDLRIELV
jgi:hypothetical protein